MVRIIGITGPVQHGKYQLEPVFVECGWRFIDLNTIIYSGRSKGTARYDDLQIRKPGIIDEDGVETGTFYQSMTRASYWDLLSEETRKLRKKVVELCAAAPDDARIVLSWEYLARLAHDIPIERMFVFTSDRAKWFQRLRDQARELGWKQEPSEGVLEHIIDMLDVQPQTILNEVRGMIFDRYEMFDVTADDWGASELRKVLARL